MKNKGQVLVVFILIIPLLFMLGGVIIDTGLLYIEKRKIDNTVKDAIEYGLDNLENNDIDKKLYNLININIDNITDIDIKVENNLINIHVFKDELGIFSHLINNKKYEIDVNYEGYIKNNDLVIIRK